MEWNAESVLDALNDFERKSEIPEILDQYLERIAKNGEIVFPWNKLKPLLKKKLEVVLDEFYETCPVETSVPVPNFETFNFDNLKKTILQAVEAFTSAPFTIQRLCELVTHPTRHYNRTDKYMRGIEKNVLVVSTLDQPRLEPDGNIVNGTVDDNDALNGHLPTPSNTAATNHVLLENFANVFPSAACIPPSSNVCDGDTDNNFMDSEELVPVEEIDGALPKDDEEMDTREDELQQKDLASEDVEVESSSSNSSLELASTDSDNANEDAKSEAEPVVEDSVEAKKPECQQDDTVSQSDDVSTKETAKVEDNEVTSDMKVDEFTDKVDSVIAGEDSIIAESDNVIAREDDIIAEEDGIVTEEDGIIAGEEGIITEKDGIIAEEDSIITEEDGIVAKEDSVKDASDNVKEGISEVSGEVANIIADVANDVAKEASDVSLPIEEDLPDVLSENIAISEPSAMEEESSGSEEPSV